MLSQAIRTNRITYRQHKIRSNHRNNKMVNTNFCNRFIHWDSIVAIIHIRPTVTSISNEVEEINTKELAQRISAELKRYSIPQAIFAQRVLCRSQGTLSDLLRNPKPWSKLKSGRETFRRMFKWLQEPEFQRMSALRMAGKYTYRALLKWWPYECEHCLWV